jgi:hypothetical protein
MTVNILNKPTTPNKDPKVILVKSTIVSGLHFKKKIKRTNEIVLVKKERYVIRKGTETDCRFFFQRTLL